MKSNKPLKKEKKYGVVGIGNAIVDILANVEDEFISEHKLEKGMMKLIDESDIEHLNKRISASKQESGGSAANTIAGLASLGNNVAFIGKVKDDLLGRSFEKGLSDLGVLYCTRRAAEGSPTACCIVLSTPDAQRTMNTFLGISGTLAVEDIDEKIISDSKIIYLEGYLWDSDNARKAFLKAIELAGKSSGEVALTLSDSFCVERHRDEFIELLEKHTDILFANEDEIKMLFQVSTFEDAAKCCRDYKTVFALTRGEAGSVIIEGSRQYLIEPERNIEVLDTTGAGDMYAAGFLHGYINNKKLDICGRIGNLTAAAVLPHFGARPGISLSDILKRSGYK